MKRRTALPFAAAVLSLAACGDSEGTEPLEVPVSVTADLVDPEGSRLGGATLADSDVGVEVEVEASGLSLGDHPVGLFETGVCELAVDVAEVPGSVGGPLEGAADIGEMSVGEGGVGRLSVLVSGIELDELLDEDGTAVVVLPAPGVDVPPEEVLGSRIACAEFTG